MHHARFGDRSWSSETNEDVALKQLARDVAAAASDCATIVRTSPAVCSKTRKVVVGDDAYYVTVSIDPPADYKEGDYYFWIRRKHGASLEWVKVSAIDSHEAVKVLPPNVYWDFASAQSVLKEWDNQ